RLAAGAVMDRVFGPHLAAFVLSLSVIASFVLLWASPTFASALLAAILVGISTGAEFNMLAFLVTKYFGLAHYGRLSGLMFGAFTTGTFFGPVLSGISYQATGSFDQALIGLAICFGVATGLMLLCSPYPRFAPQRESVAA
ncbi:MAG: MFS transporter, partial [Caulobacterales bacterium]